MFKIPFFRREGSILSNVVLLLLAFLVFHYALLTIEKKQGFPAQQTLSSKKQGVPRAEKSQSNGKQRGTPAGVTPTVGGQQDSATKSSGRKTYAFDMRPKQRQRSSQKTKDSTMKSGVRKNKFLGGQVVDLADEWTDEKMASQAKVFAERTAALAASCEQLGDDEALHPNILQVHGNIRWVSKHNLIWCPVYKAASTTWMSNLLLLAGIKYANMSLHKRVSQLYQPPEDLEERENLLNTSLRMLIVRHPLERLLSAYRDKMLRDDQFQRVSETMKTKYPDPKGIKENGNHPTFKQFLMYVQDCMQKFWSSGGKTRLNPHWQPVWWTCGPCQVNYDAIAHVETLTLDQEYVIRKTGLTNLAFNAHTHASNFDSYNGTNEATRNYFSKIPKKLLKKVADLYRYDFEFFGYSPDEYIQMGTGKS